MTVRPAPYDGFGQWMTLKVCDRYKKSDDGYLEEKRAVLDEQ